MTGFARAGGLEDWGAWTWEAKSVNGKGLDARVSVPSGYEKLERAMKAAVSEMFDRGNFQISLRIDRAESDASLAVNTAALSALIQAYEAVEGAAPTGAALAALFSVKGVTEVQTDNRRQDVEEAIISHLETAGRGVLTDLQTSRVSEGLALKEILLGQMYESEQIVSRSVAFASDQAKTIQAQFTTRLADLDVQGAVSDDRLVSEIAILAAKADVSEEIDRLQAHIAAARASLEAGGPIGRSLGFLAQELNREANTICSKSASLDLTNVGLALKSVIDQFKEQAANVE